MIKAILSVRERGREREREKEKIRHKKDVKLKLISYTYSAVKLNVNQSVMFCVFCIKKRCLRLKLFMIVIIVVSIPFFGLHISTNKSRSLMKYDMVDNTILI